MTFPEWMQYPDGGVEGVPGRNAVDRKVRPPLAPCGQARFDAARPPRRTESCSRRGERPQPARRPDDPPKLLNLPNPFEMVQIPVRVFMFFELGYLWRTIWTEGRPLPKDPDRTWLGYSVGRWEGDTFIVETIGFKDKQWDDSFGNPRSEQTRLSERYRASIMTGSKCKSSSTIPKRIRESGSALRSSTNGRLRGR
jgi:hypothetical protein